MTARSSEIPVSALVAASRRPEVVACMRDFYAEADRRIAGHGATCWNKGACCRFGEFGHRLYVTALEAAYYLATGDLLEDQGQDARATAEPEAPYYLAVGDPPPALTADACPHAHGGRCHARDRRPLGCRVFYCDPDAQDWQGPLTEELLARLRFLHHGLAVPYVYADWLTVLRAIGAGSGPGEHSTRIAHS